MSIEGLRFDRIHKANRTRDVDRVLEAEERHFWHRARNGFIARKLVRAGVPRGARVLELGCGAGCVAADPLFCRP